MHWEGCDTWVVGWILEGGGLTDGSVIWVAVAVPVTSVVVLVAATAAAALLSIGGLEEGLV